MILHEKLSAQLPAWRERVKALVKENGEKVIDQVTIGQTLGQTGETGLAGGDHLHFSILLRGVHVDPVEWWDPHWLHDHVTPKLTMFPQATTAQLDHTHEQTKP